MTISQVAAMTVNEMIRRYPATVAVFSSFGIDACCGGALPIAEAACRHRVDLDLLTARLAEAADQAA